MKRVRSGVDSSASGICTKAVNRNAFALVRLF